MWAGNLPGFGPNQHDEFRFTWWNTREGAACWIEYRRSWWPAVIVHRGRDYVSVAIAGPKGRTWYVRRRYGELRRRIVKPRLVAVEGRASIGERRG